jgi:hypothetical protein
VSSREKDETGGFTACPERERSFDATERPKNVRMGFITTFPNVRKTFIAAKS